MSVPLTTPTTRPGRPVSPCACAIRNDERGATLVLMMLMMTILSGLASGMVFTGRTDLTIADNDVSAGQARAAAEAGLSHGVDVVLGFLGGAGAADDLLRGPDGATGTPQSDADNGSLENLGIPRPPAALQVGGLNGVAYQVRVLDEEDAARLLALTPADLARIGEDGDPFADGNQRLVIHATGTAPGGGSVTLETMVTTAGGPGPGFLVGGPLTINGNPVFQGPGGSVHANGDTDVSGNPTIEHDLTSSGNLNVSGSPSVGGTQDGGLPPVTVPAVQAADHFGAADFVLTAGGQLTTPGGSLICDASSDNSACSDLGYGFDYKGANGWDLAEDSLPAGTYYAQNDVTISGNPGLNGPPVAIAIVSEGSISVSGTPVLAGDEGLLFVTDGDLTISGNPQVSFEGDVLVHEQIKLSGNLGATGRFVIENAASNFSDVVSNQVSGNPTITIPDGNGGGGGGAVVSDSWREVR